MYYRGQLVMQLPKLPHVAPACYTDASSRPGYFASDAPLCWESGERCPKCLGHRIHMSDPEEVTGSCLSPVPTLAIIALWRMKTQQVENLLLSISPSSCVTVSSNKENKPFKKIF